MQRNKFLLGMILIVAIAVVFLYPGYRRVKTLGQRVELLNKDIKVLEEKKRKLREEIEAIKNDPFYQEKLAREMGLAKPGEVVYEVTYAEEGEDEGERRESEASGR